MTELYRIADNIYRILHYTGRRPRQSLLSKYKLIDLAPDGEPELLRADEDPCVTLERGYSLTFSLDAGEDGGFDIRLPLDPADRLFGLGDESRSCIEKRGQVALMKQENVRSYGPVPYLMSSRGWAVLVNCTYAHTFDIGAANPDELHIYGDRGALDLIVFTGTGLHDALYLAGRVMGRPVMLPKSAYGLTYVLNEEANARTLLDDALRFRERNIPCDILGLEPSWMEKRYDYSVDKKWNPGKFPFPSWRPENYYGSWSFMWNLHQLGRKLSLWLCCDYDLLWKEENDAYIDEVKSNADAEINDAHFARGIRMDTITKPGEAWFDHLKKFVDNGAEAFKLDGAAQVIPHPDRLWAGRYTDDEVRNLYPVVYAKQMKEGYEAHTGKRAMIYTCGTYPGTQKYAATWAGDTGCDTRVLLSLINLGMCGHSNASFDMTCDDKRKIHFGFLAPWSQHQGWANWLYPWYSGEAIEESYRRYSQLRSQLFPYIYSMSHKANRTSLPTLRALSLAYPDTDRYDQVYNEYLFGDSLLVSAFDDHLNLPVEDNWYDFHTGALYTGPREFDYTGPDWCGGAIFVRAGSIIVTQDWAHSLCNHRPDKLYVHVYPGKDAAFTLYEDDGTTYGYEHGEIAATRFTLSGNTLRIAMREGAFPNMPSVNAFEVIWHHADGTTATYSVTAADHESSEVIIEDI
ncbi:MAG: glycoside hydrolase family 31 protein [Clostridia bacterium]|nr:glycoside hydrolase family 31 protein [Clostridia bacterium]